MCISAMLNKSIVWLVKRLKLFSLTYCDKLKQLQQTKYAIWINDLSGIFFCIKAFHFQIPDDKIRNTSTNVIVFLWQLNFPTALFLLLYKIRAVTAINYCKQLQCGNINVMKIVIVYYGLLFKARTSSAV